MNRLRYPILICLLLLGAFSLNTAAAPQQPDKPAAPASINASTCPTADPYEDDAGAGRDDTFTAASTITQAGQPGHTFDRWSDKDWAQFSAAAGARYVIQTSNLAPNYDPDGFFADTVLEIYAADGVTLLDSNDDFGGSYASRLDWQAPAAGKYYLKVYNYNPSVYGCEVGYDLLFALASQLQITKSAQDLNGAPLYEEDLIRYTIIVSNPGPDARTDIVIRDPLPDGTTLVANSITLNPSANGWTVAATTPQLEVHGASLAPGAALTITFDVRVDKGTVGQTISNQAHVDCAQLDEQSSDWITPPGGGTVTPQDTPVIFLPITVFN